MKIKISTIIWIVVGVLFFVWLFWPIEEYTTFSFIIEETNDTINGEIFLDGVFLGSTQEGKIDIGYLEIIPYEFTFKGEYNGEEFEVLYDFPNDYLEYYEVPFSISEEYIGELEDAYSNITELHWGHMPLTYSIEDEDECGNETNTIIISFKIIQNSTENVISFNKTSDFQNADIKIDCKLVGTYLSGEQTLGEAFFNNEGNLITSAEITYFVKGPKEFRVVEYCQTGFPRIEVHEMLHVFGFGHDNSPTHIMKMINTAGKCGVNKINRELVNCLKYIYSNGEIRTSCYNINFIEGIL